MGADRNNISDDAQPNLVWSRYEDNRSLLHQVLTWQLWKEAVPDISVQVEPLLSSSGLLCHLFSQVCKVGLDEIQMLRQ